MPSKLILHINNKILPSKVNWLILPTNKQHIDHPQQTSWSQLPTINKKDELILIVPATDVSLKTLQLPKVNRRKTRQAIPYMLEEHLAENPEQLHFPFIRDKNDDLASIAIVKKELMVKWLAYLSSHQLKITACIPESLLLPIHNDGWTIVLEDQLAIIRFNRYQGTAIEQSLLPYLLEQKLNDLKKGKHDSIGENKDHTDHIARPIFHIYLHSVEQYKGLLAKIKGQTKLHIQDKPLLLMLADTFQNNTPPLNLLQDEFQPIKKINKRSWMMTLCLLMGIIPLMFTAKFTQNLILKDQLITANTQVKSSYLQIFPEATSVTAPRIRIQEKIDALIQGQQNSPFIQLLSIAGDSLQQIPGIKLNSLTFNNEQLTMQLETNSAANLDRFSNALRQGNIQITENNISAENNAVAGTLSIALKPD